MVWQVTFFSIISAEVMVDSVFPYAVYTVLGEIWQMDTQHEMEMIL